MCALSAPPPVLTSTRSDDADDIYHCQSIIRTLSYHRISFTAPKNCAYGWFYW